MQQLSFRMLVKVTLVSYCLGVPLVGCVVHDDAGRDPHYAEHHQDHPQDHPESHPAPEQQHQEEHH
jgi:hypothetical protein